MSHWAQLDENNIVIQVLVGDNNSDDEGYSLLVETFGGKWVKTSYNGNIRKRFAGIGYTYNEELDIFLEPKPYEDWVIDSASLDWAPSIPFPENELPHRWDQDTKTWIPIKKPYPSWICRNRCWVAPVDQPVSEDPNTGVRWKWNEARQAWVKPI